METSNLIEKYADTLKEHNKEIEHEQMKLLTEIERLKSVVKVLNYFSEQPEWPDSWIKINPLAYVPATIMHTAEQHVVLCSEGRALMTLKETLAYLDRKMQRLQEAHDAYELHKRQLSERDKLLANNFKIDQDEKSQQMQSELGIAYKTATGLYEIVEAYDEEREKRLCQRRIRAKGEAANESVKENHERFFTRLNQLEEQERTNGELDLEMITSKKEEVCFRVSKIISELSLREKLLEDEIVANYCGKGSDVENTIDNLIKEVLTNRQPCNTSSANLNDYLDAIESCNL